MSRPTKSPEKEFFLDKFDPNHQPIVQKIEEERVAKEEYDNRPNIFVRKAQRIFGGVNEAQKLFFHGFKFGSIVGGSFGGLIGLFYAFQKRQFIYFPMSAIGSGLSFGFFMGLGFILRNQMAEIEDEGENRGDWVKDYSIYRKGNGI